MAKNHSENNGKKPLFWEWEFSILVKGVLNLLGNFHYFKNGKFPFIFNSEWKKSILKSYGGLPFNSVWVVAWFLKYCKISPLIYQYTEKKFWIRLSGKVNNIISTWVLIYNFHLIWNLFFIYNQLMWHNVNPIYRKYFCGTIHINKRKPGGRFKPNDTIQSSQILPLRHCCYLNS